MNAYVAVIDEVVCANGKANIDLLAGPRDSIDFLVILADKYQRETANGCTPKVNGKQPYIKYAFQCDQVEPKEMYELKHAQLFAGQLSMSSLPDRLDSVKIHNNLTVDVKISILAAHTKPKPSNDCDPTQWKQMPTEAAAN